MNFTFAPNTLEEINMQYGAKKLHGFEKEKTPITRGILTIKIYRDVHWF
jgi:hypothetical protein